MKTEQQQHNLVWEETPDWRKLDKGVKFIARCSCGLVYGDDRTGYKANYRLASERLHPYHLYEVRQLLIDSTYQI